MCEVNILNQLLVLSQSKTNDGNDDFPRAVLIARYCADPQDILKVQITLSNNKGNQKRQKERRPR